ncbi:MAG: NADH dehydrogenase (quinone) subunit D [Candidatus Lernaella stagnicola]|nr:NADH dehydrogenase (quinone) subunit D [Candidatus Lernaella stagnicola]
MGEPRYMTLNMGPQHPSTHGVLQIILTLDGERVVEARPVLGYLHRGIEKLAEGMSYHQIIPLTDRLDYTACMSCNLGYVWAVERLLGIEDQIPERARVIRVICAELSRIGGHMIWLGSHAADIGAVTVFLYTFREREFIYELFEEISGQRMTVSYPRIGGVSHDLPAGWVEKCHEFCRIFLKKVDEYEQLLTNNRIWRLRTEGIGVLTREDVLEWGVSGPMARGSGIAYDLRKVMPYGDYDQYDFEVPTQEAGDTFARYVVRIAELRQSVRIIRQGLERLADGPIMADIPTITPPPKADLGERIEQLIHHFHLVVEGFNAPAGEVYFASEAPKGELGFTLVADGGPHPHRCAIRVPSFANLHSIVKMAPGHYLADMVALIGTIDICLADIDK